MQEYIFKEDTVISDFFDVQETNLLGYDHDQNPEDSEPTTSAKKILTTVKRNVVYCNNLEALLIFLKKERQLGDNSVVKIGIDGGRGSIKVMLTIHDPNEKDSRKSPKSSLLSSPKSPRKKRRKQKALSRLQKEYLNSGDKKCVILGLVQDIPENYENVKKLLELIDIGSIQHHLACDMKLQNILLGLQGHSATHPCVYCTGQKPWDCPGELRTLGGIKEQVKNYEKAPKSKKIAKNFYNCVNAPIIVGDDDDRIIDILPLAELHLVLGITNTLLFKANALEGFDLVIKWANNLNCYQEKFGSKQFNGERCVTLLNNMESLIKVLPRKLKFFGKALKAFNQVRKSCFGDDLDEDYKQKIEEFESVFRSIGPDQPVFPKAHIVFHHLADFIEEHGPLGPFNEQTFEAVHYSFANHMDTSKYSRHS